MVAKMQASNGDMFDNLRNASFSEKDLAFINNIMKGTFAVNADIIHFLRKLLEKALHTSETNAGLEAVKKIINCLLETIQQEGRYDWKELHLQFVMLLRLCFNFVSIIANNSETFLELAAKLLGVIEISSTKSEDMKNTMVKALSTSMIDFILNSNILLILRRNVTKIFNNILSGSSRNLRMEISVAVRGQLAKLADQLFNCGDYEFQTTMLELIFRFITIKGDREQFKSWFSQYPEVEKAFVSISFKDFDPDCRTFLNTVNFTMADKRQVFTYPCVKVFMNKKEIVKPRDESYKEFWVDFSLGSSCINILCDGSSFMPKGTGNVWELICIPAALVTRASLRQGNEMNGVSDNMQILALEANDQNRKDIFLNLSPLEARTFEIIFEDVTVINSLNQKILPTLFGNRFEVTNISKEVKHPKLPNLRLQGGFRGVTTRKSGKMSDSGLISLSSTSVASSHLSKYSPLDIVKSPRNLKGSRIQEKRSGTEMLTIVRNAEISPHIDTRPQSTVEKRMEESPDPSKGLKETLEAHTKKNFAAITPSVIISPQLSMISEEVSHQSETSNLNITSTSVKNIPDAKNCSITSVSLINESSDSSKMTDRNNIKYQYWSSDLEPFIISKNTTSVQKSKMSIMPKIHITRIDRINPKFLKTSTTDRLEVFNNSSKLELEQAMNTSVSEKKKLREHESSNLSLSSISKTHNTNQGGNSEENETNQIIRVEDSVTVTNKTQREESLNQISENKKMVEIGNETSIVSDPKTFSEIVRFQSSKDAPNQQMYSEHLERFSERNNIFSTAKITIENPRKNIILESSESSEDLKVDTDKQETCSKKLDKLSNRNIMFSTATATIEKSRKHSVPDSSKSLKDLNNTVKEQRGCGNLSKNSKKNNIDSVIKTVIQKTRRGNVLCLDESSKDLRVKKSNDVCKEQICSETVLSERHSIAKAVVERPGNNRILELSESPENAVGLKENSMNDATEQQKHAAVLKIKSVSSVKSKCKSSKASSMKVCNIPKISKELVIEENAAHSALKYNSLNKNISECETTAEITETNIDEVPLNAVNSNENTDKKILGQLNEINKKNNLNKILNKEDEFTETCASISKSILQDVIDNDSDMFGEKEKDAFSGNSIENLLRILDSQEYIKNKESCDLGNNKVGADKEQIINLNIALKENEKTVKHGVQDIAAESDQNERISEVHSKLNPDETINCTEAIQSVNKEKITQDSYEKIKSTGESTDFKGFNGQGEQNKETVNAENRSKKKSDSEIKKNKRLACRKLRSHIKSKEKPSESECERNSNVEMKKNIPIPSMVRADKQSALQRVKTCTKSKENKNVSESEHDLYAGRKQQTPISNAVLLHQKSAAEEVRKGRGQHDENKGGDGSISLRDKQTSCENMINIDNDSESQRKSESDAEGKYASVTTKIDINPVVRLERIGYFKNSFNKSSTCQDSVSGKVDNTSSKQLVTVDKTIDHVDVRISQNEVNEFVKNINSNEDADNNQVINAKDDEFDIETASTQILQPQGMKSVAETLTVLPVNELKITSEEVHPLQDTIKKSMKDSSKSNISLHKDNGIEEKSDETVEPLGAVIEHILKDWESSEDLLPEKNCNKESNVKTNNFDSRTLPKNSKKLHCGDTNNTGILIKAKNKSNNNGTLGMAKNKKETESDKTIHNNNIKEIPSCTTKMIVKRAESVISTKKQSPCDNEKNKVPEIVIMTSGKNAEQKEHPTHANKRNKSHKTDVGKIATMKFTLESDSSYKYKADQISKPTQVRINEFSKRDNSLGKIGTCQVSENLEVTKCKTSGIVEQILEDWPASEEADENNKSSPSGSSSKSQQRRNVSKDLEIETVNNLQQNSSSVHEISKVQNRDGNKLDDGGGIKSNVDHLHSPRTSKKYSSISSSKLDEIKSLIELKTRKIQDVSSNVEKSVIKESANRTASGMKTPVCERIKRTDELSNTKSSSRKRKLYSETNSPELIEIEDYDNSSCDPQWTPKRPTTWRRKRLFTSKKKNANKKKCESKKEGRSKIGTEIPTFNFETTSLALGEFSPKNTSRWKSRYMNSLEKQKSERMSQDNKCLQEHSIYSDFGSDSDSNPSWFTTTKAKPSKFRKPKTTYEKKHTGKFPSKQVRKQTFNSNKSTRKGGNITNLNSNKSSNTYVGNLPSEDDYVLRHDDENFGDREVREGMNILRKIKNIRSSDNESLPSLIVESVKEPVYRGKYSPLYLSNEEDEIMTVNKENIDRPTNPNNIEILVTEAHSSTEGNRKFKINDKTKVIKERIKEASTDASRDCNTQKKALSKGKRTAFVKEESCKYGHMLKNRPPVRDLNSDGKVCNSQEKTSYKLPSKYVHSRKVCPKSKSLAVTLPHSERKNDNVQNITSSRHPSEQIKKLTQTDSPYKQKKNHISNAERHISGVGKKNNESLIGNKNKVDISGSSLKSYNESLAERKKKNDSAVESEESYNHESIIVQRKGGESMRSNYDSLAGAQKRGYVSNGSEISNCKSLVNAQKDNYNSEISERSNHEIQNGAQEGSVTNNHKLLVGGKHESYRESERSNHKSLVKTQIRNPISKTSVKSSLESSIRPQKSISGLGESKKRDHDSLFGSSISHISEDLQTCIVNHGSYFSDRLNDQEATDKTHFDFCLSHSRDQSDLEEALEESPRAPQTDSKYETVIPVLNNDMFIDDFEEFVREFADSFENEENPCKTMKLNNEKSDNIRDLTSTEIKRKLKNKPRRSKQMKTHEANTPIYNKTANYFEDIIIQPPEMDVPVPSVSFSNELDSSLVPSFSGKTNKHQVNISKNLCLKTSDCGYLHDSEEKENNTCMNTNIDFRTKDKSSNFSVMGVLSSSYVINDVDVNSTLAWKNTQNVSSRSSILSNGSNRNLDTVKRNKFQSSNLGNTSISECIDSSIAAYNPGHKALNDPYSSPSKRRKKLKKANPLKEVRQSNINSVLSSGDEIKSCNVIDNPVLEKNKVKKLEYSQSKTKNSDPELLSLDFTLPSSTKRKRTSKSAIMSISSQENLNSSHQLSNINENAISGNSKTKKKHRSHWKDTETSHNTEENALGPSFYPTSTMTDTKGTDLLDVSSSNIAEFMEHNASYELTASTPWTVMESRKMRQQEYFRPFFKETEHTIENNFMENFTRGHDRRKEIVNGYCEEKEKEFRNLQKNIENWEHQEERLRKLDKYVRHSFSLYREYAEDLIQCKSKVQNIQHCFNKGWKKAEKEQRKFSAELNEDLEKQLDALVTKRINDDNSSDVKKLRLKMKTLLGLVADTE